MTEHHCGDPNSACDMECVERARRIAAEDARIKRAYQRGLRRAVEIAKDRRTQLVTSSVGVGWNGAINDVAKAIEAELKEQGDE